MIRINRIPFVIVALAFVLLFVVFQSIVYLLGEWGGFHTGLNLIAACLSPLKANPIAEQICNYAVTALSAYSLLKLAAMFIKLTYLEIKWRLLFESKRSSLYEKRLRDEYPEMRVKVLNDQAFIALTKGFLRPCIYISSGVLKRFDAKEVEAILLHEQHHCQSHDPLKNGLVTLLTEAFGYIPFVRKVAQYFMTWREIEADRYTVQSMGTIEYIGSVLCRVSRMPITSATLGTAGFADHSVNFRIQHLLEPKDELKVPLLDSLLLIKSAFILGSILLIIVGGCL